MSKLTREQIESRRGANGAGNATIKRLCVQLLSTMDELEAAERKALMYFNTMDKAEQLLKDIGELPDKWDSIMKSNKATINGNGCGNQLRKALLNKD